MSSKNSIQSLINTYLERHGSIDILLPDGVGLEIGITQEGKHGLEKLHDYCWVVTKREDRSTVIDKYSMSMFFEDSAKCIVDQNDRGIVSVI